MKSVFVVLVAVVVVAIVFAPDLGEAQNMTTNDENLTDA
jgi:hypothetical protein